MKKFTLLSIAALFLCLTSAIAASNLPITGTLSPTIPADWTYITNDAAYPNPSFYTTAGLTGIKFSFENQGIQSPEFTPNTNITVTLLVNALNQNTKTGTNTNFFTITGLNASNEVVATAYLTTVIKGENKVELSGVNIVKVKVVMTGYPYDGAKYNNVNLASVTIAEKSTGVKFPKVNPFNLTVAGNRLLINNVANGSTVEIYSALGSKIQSEQLISNTVNISKLSKGLYVIRIGKETQKFIVQ